LLEQGVVQSTHQNGFGEHCSRLPCGIRILTGPAPLAVGSATEQEYSFNNVRWRPCKPALAAVRFIDGDPPRLGEGGRDQIVLALTVAHHKDPHSVAPPVRLGAREQPAGGQAAQAQPPSSSLLLHVLGRYAAGYAVPACILSDFPMYFSFGSPAHQ
jgi:hypothetical protein